MLLYDSHFDAIVIGGGFYGTSIAIYLAKKRGLKRVLLIEKELKLLSRASFNNQARIHNGLHYPRNFKTAYRSRINFPKFISEWTPSVRKNFTKFYAISRNNSKVTAKQFELFSKEIGAEIEQVSKSEMALFNTRTIEKAYKVHEYVFDANEIETLAKKELHESGVLINVNTQLTSIASSTDNKINVYLKSDNNEKIATSKYVFNCCYSGINKIENKFFDDIKFNLKHEIAEIALIQVPNELQNVGITVMDGPFFSTIPFPARELHSLSHVRYTPHCNWEDCAKIDPYKKLKEYDCNTRVDRMIRDAARYVPIIFESKYIDSIFEIKTVLTKNEIDDGRPILFDKSIKLSGYYSILGSKIDNIYDILEKLNEEIF